MEYNKKLLHSMLLTGNFRTNFEKLMISAQCNKIHVMTGDQFRIIAVLVFSLIHVDPGWSFLPNLVYGCLPDIKGNCQLFQRTFLSASG